MESVKEETHETPLCLKQEDQDVESEIEWMLLSELLLSVLLELLKFEVVQCYDKLRKLEFTLMDQVIGLTIPKVWVSWRYHCKFAEVNFYNFKKKKKKKKKKK